MLISHDLGVVSQLLRPAARHVRRPDRRVRARPRRSSARPAHPYTRALLASIPRMAGELPDRLPTIPGSPPHGGGNGVGLPVRAPLPAGARGSVPRPIRPCWRSRSPNGPGRLSSGRVPRARRRKLESGRLMTDPAHVQSRPDEQTAAAPPVVDVRDLRVHFKVHEGLVGRQLGSAVEDVVFVDRGRADPRRGRRVRLGQVDRRPRVGARQPAHRPGRSSVGEPRSPRLSGPRAAGASGGRCRWCSRIPTTPSTPG